MANKPGEANFFPDVPVYPEMGAFMPVYGKFDLTTYIQGASDYEIMAFLVGKYNACLEAYGNITKLSTDTITACKQLQDWINSWFTNLDVQEEINKKIDSMVADGSFGTLLHQTFDAQINQQTTSAVTAWLVANVTPTGSAVIVDKSLSIDGAAADAKTVGTKGLLNRGEVIGNFSNNTLAGYYGFTKESLAAIADKPSNLEHGGFLAVYPDTAANQIMQYVYDTYGNVWMRFGTNDFVQIVDAVNTMHNNGSVTGNFSDNKLAGYYGFTKDAIATIADKPSNLEHGGFLAVYPDTAANQIMQYVYDTYGNVWMRFGTNDFVQIVGNVNEPTTKWIAFGDSITQGFYSDSGSIDGVTSKNYVNKLAAINNYSVTNMGQGGSGFLHKGTVDSKQSGREIIVNTDVSTYDLCTFAYGVNDWHYNEIIGDESDAVGNNSMCGYMKECIEHIYTSNPYIKLIVILPFNTSKFGGSASTNWGLNTSLPTSGTLQSVIDKQKAICEQYKIEYIDCTNAGAINNLNINTVLGDGLHPTIKGYEVIARTLANLINFK